MESKRHPKPEKTRGTGTTVPQIQLDSQTRQDIIALFTRNPIQNEQAFFQVIEQGIRTCLIFAKSEEQYSSDQVRYKTEKLVSLISQLHEMMSSSNLSVLAQIEAMYYENTGKLFKREYFISELNNLIKNVEHQRAPNRKRRYTYIHSATASVVDALSKYSTYKIHASETSKLVQIMELLLPPIQKSLKQILVTDEIHLGYARNIAGDYLKHHYIQTK